MSKCYYSYSFDLENGLIYEEGLPKNIFSPMRAFGLKTPLDFDDYIDVWKSLCFPVFQNEGDEEKLTRYYFKSAYDRGEHAISIDLEHNPLKSTYSFKFTRVNVKLFEDKKTKRARATVMWMDNPELERQITLQNQCQSDRTAQV